MPKKAGKIRLRCDICGKLVQRYPSQYNGRSVYCSKSCVGKMHRHGSTLVCAMCDKEFYRRYGEQDREVRKNQFCSKECYSAWRYENRGPKTYLKTGHEHTHRVVAKAVLGRDLTKDEVVHHIDGNCSNNHPSNLAVFPSQSEHTRCHFGKVGDDFVEKYKLTELSGDCK